MSDKIEWPEGATFIKQRAQKLSDKAELAALKAKPSEADMSSAIEKYEQALLAAFPQGASGHVFDLWNEARANQHIKVGEEAEPFAWAEFDGEGGYELRLAEDNEGFRDEYIKRNGEKYASWVFGLYTAPPAHGVVVPDNLYERCAEILNWRKTGILTGNFLRSYAAGKRYAGYHSELQIAEHDTAREAYELLAAIAEQKE